MSSNHCAGAASVVSIRVKALDSLVVVTSEMLSATDVELLLL